MAVRHESLPLHGVQFHPESVLTEGGHRILANWLVLCGMPDAVQRSAGLSPLVRDAEGVARMVVSRLAPSLSARSSLRGWTSVWRASSAGSGWWWAPPASSWSSVGAWSWSGWAVLAGPPSASTWVP